MQHLGAGLALVAEDEDGGEVLVAVAHGLLLLKALDGGGHCRQRLVGGHLHELEELTYRPLHK